METVKRQMKRFDRDFKISAVKMVAEGGHTVAEVARSLGIHANQLYNWEKKYKIVGSVPDNPMQYIMLMLKCPYGGILIATL